MSNNANNQVVTKRVEMVVKHPLVTLAGFVMIVTTVGNIIITHAEIKYGRKKSVPSKKKTTKKSSK